jgi:hypothetical protein
MTSAVYDKDFFAWANEQAALLRSGRLAEADIEHIAQEIESMGKTEKRELISRLTVLLLHLLKWCYQPALRGASWWATIKVQRRDIVRHLDDNPSLRANIGQAMTAAYGDAIILAAAETGFTEASFPASSPWPFEQAIDADFWPEN